MEFILCVSFYFLSTKHASSKQTKCSLGSYGSATEYHETCSPTLARNVRDTH
jgi:hypothetical protein